MDGLPRVGGARLGRFAIIGVKPRIRSHNLCADFWAFFGTFGLTTGGGCVLCRVRLCTRGCRFRALESIHRLECLASALSTRLNPLVQKIGGGIPSPASIPLLVPAAAAGPCLPPVLVPVPPKGNAAQGRPPTTRSPIWAWGVNLSCCLFATCQSGHLAVPEADHVPFGHSDCL